jgi:ArsR family transcriptional regulator
MDVKTQARYEARAKIVEDEKRGSMVFYRLRCPCILDFFGCVETVMKNNARQQRKLC